MLIIESQTNCKLRTHTPSSIYLKHISFWCQIFDIPLTSHHLNIGVQFGHVSELGPYTITIVGEQVIASKQVGRYVGKNEIHARDK
jgi:hypothetical protein